MPRFVILAHDHPVLHWDLMLEVGESLLTWRLDSPPDLQWPVVAERITDHRPMYLDYSGPVSGGRGTVTPWDAGEFDWSEDTDGRKVVTLKGRRLEGTFILERIDENMWRGVFAV